MNSNKYTYTLLRYRHSSLLDESLNIGLLVYFHKSKEFVFEYSKNLGRIKSIYFSVAEKTIKQYLKQISLRAKRFSNLNDDILRFEIENSFDDFIEEYILSENGSSLLFSKSFENNQYENSDEYILNYLNDLFLFELTGHSDNKEYLLGKKFYDTISHHPNVREKGTSNKPNFYKDYTVQNKSSGVEYNFKYAWLNGTTNLVKPLNFDLKQAKSLEKKGYENFGIFSNLKIEHTEEDFEYHLIIGKPTHKELFRTYDNSIKLLDDLPKVKVFEEDELNKYKKKLIETIRKEDEY
ncbi:MULTISPECIES: DUF3037 domain-containing protein [Arenibacter]|uniref:DUF3037 domain-containing protein n=1 Tax=Arenibacter TaxID=178469 RepID=UPI0004DF9AD1|nr:MULTISPECIES: DUF3037 domain-containing protein [Arenibacter]GBF21185.1 hypothetical protein C21_03368 [Arenibacter sp. NBRC 103722]